MKFKNKTTGVIIEVTSEFVLEQMKKSADYEELKEVRKETPKLEKEVKEVKETKADKKSK